MFTDGLIVVFFSFSCRDIEGVLTKGPYPPCLRMADRALLAGYPRLLSSNAWLSFKVRILELKIIIWLDYEIQSNLLRIIISV